MKRFLLLLLCLCVALPAALADGEASDGWWAVVACPPGSGRLNLRAEMSVEAESLGRFYNGTLVRVVDAEGEWAHVTIGASGLGTISGYMKAMYLDFMLRNVPVELPGITVTQAQGTAIYDRLGSGAAILATLEEGSTVSILGDLPNGYFVEVGGLTGYLPASTLPEGGTTNLPTGENVMYVNNPNSAERLNLRAEASAQAASLGKFYNGTPVVALAVSDGWTKVAVGPLTGWMMTKYLVQGSPMTVGAQVVQTHANVVLLDAPRQQGLTLTGFSAGTIIQLYGDLEDGWHYACWNNRWGFIEESDIERNLNLDLSFENGAAG